METSQIQEIIDELKVQNPGVAPRVLRETVSFAVRAGEKSEPQDEKTEILYPAIFFASAQSYLNGYAAFVDEDYNREETAIDPDINDELTRSSLMSFSEMVPSYMIARASHHVAVLMKAQPPAITELLGNAIAAVAGNGFIAGFCAAKSDADEGVTVSYALKPPTDEECKRAARWGVKAAGLIPEKSESVVEATALRCGEMARAKILTRSGVSRLEPDGAGECMDVYALAYVNGLVNGFSSGKFEKLSDLPTPEGMEVTEAEIKAWCRQRKYPDSLIEASLSACRALHAEGDGASRDGGAFMLTGWGYADGLAETFEFTDTEDEIAAEIHKIFAAIGM